MPQPSQAAQWQPGAPQPDRWQSRSVVLSRDGVVAAESPLAAQAGAQILACGGHAVDAAVAVNAVMGVVAPHSNGLGGDMFAIVYETASRKLYGLNASGWSPAAMSIEWLKSRSIDEMPQSGIHSFTVPGTADGWDKLLNRFGRMRLPQVLAPAIHHATQGFPVTEWAAQRWSAGQHVLRSDANAVRTFLPDDRPLRVGEIFYNRDLAGSLEQLAAGSRDSFYTGLTGDRILETCGQYGGAMTTEDLASYSSEWVDPISTTYRGWTIYELPPNGSGVAALLMLNIMEHFPLGDLNHNSADSLHIQIEAKKLAYADMLQHVSDPRTSRVPVAELLSKSYAKERSLTIQQQQASSSVSPGQIRLPGGNTTYLSVVDREGNMVSLIQSNFAIFGAGIVPEKTGFVLQNRGGLFSLDPAHPNALAGRKRPLHTIIPGFMAKDSVRIAFGIMGGWNQPQAHAQFVSNIVDHGMNIQAGLEAARFTKQTFSGCDVQMERRVAPEVREDLSRRGHQIDVLGFYSDIVGGGQAVLRDDSAGTNAGASDPRKDGAAIPEPPAVNTRARLEKPIATGC
jgi:gamma-glutamyltranspeptidase/glutathione hydrolase